MYDLGRWEGLVKSFRLAVYNLNTLPTEPLLHLALYGGLASLKLPACYDKSQTQNPDCPTCDEAGLGKLAEEVPWSHHVNSTIVCAITGKIMNEDNQPMAFPNGNVYSREVRSNATYHELSLTSVLQALRAMVENDEDPVTCPRSGERIPFSRLRKVFIS